MAAVPTDDIPVSTLSAGGPYGAWRFSSARVLHNRRIASYRFTTELWLHSDMPGAWCFATLPPDVADEIRASHERRGFGSVPVDVVLGETRWDTSVFPDRASGSFLLPVKAAVRRAEDVDGGDTVTLTITTRG